MADVSRETRLDNLRRLVVAENDRQNLVSRTTIADFRTRHIDDSIQLNDLLPDGVVVDIGSGGGFPGLVLAILRDAPVILVEPRRRRADFLRAAAAALELTNVRVEACRVERIAGPVAAGITARAVAPLEALFAMAAHLSRDTTRWVLPKGRTAHAELETARRAWHGRFALVPSRTDPSASVIVAEHLRRIAP